MNLEDQIPLFEKFIKDISLIQQNQDTDIIREAIIQYPYFQTAQLLYIISKNQVDSIFSDEELVQAAIYCGSRTKLYYYLSGETNPSDFMPLFNIKNDYNIVEEVKVEESPIIGILPVEEILPDTEIKPEVTKPNPKKEAVNSIIDKFIKENPSIQKPVTEFYSPSSMAAKSLEEDIDLATETLAKIYVRKGNYAKAIRIYEKLILYYPEKSNYFATLIESLRDKINE
jgi:hypothetical protein